MWTNLEERVSAAFSGMLYPLLTTKELVARTLPSDEYTEDDLQQCLRQMASQSRLHLIIRKGNPTQIYILYGTPEGCKRYLVSRKNAQTGWALLCATEGRAAREALVVPYAQIGNLLGGRRRRNILNDLDALERAGICKKLVVRGEGSQSPRALFQVTQMDCAVAGRSSLNTATVISLADVPAAPATNRKDTRAARPAPAKRAPQAPSRKIAPPSPQGSSNPNPKEEAEVAAAGDLVEGKWFEILATEVRLTGDLVESLQQELATAQLSDPIADDPDLQRLLAARAEFNGSAERFPEIIAPLDKKIQEIRGRQSAIKEARKREVNALTERLARIRRATNACFDQLRTATEHPRQPAS